MSKPGWDLVNDELFEELLQQNLPDMPPDSVAQEVTPWRNAMNRILVGLALCAVTFSFLGLNYILPTVGMLLLLLGFRSLRNENRYFKACWIVTMIRVAVHFLAMIMNATIYQMTMSELPVMKWTAGLAAILLVVTCVCFWCGLRQLRQKTGVTFRTCAAGALVWWYVVAILLALLQVTGILIGFSYVVIYILILYCLYRQSCELDHAGYALHPSAVKISNGKLVGILLFVLFVGIGCGYLVGGKYPMDWQQVEASQHDQVADIKMDLIRMGFPENILNDMSAEDIADCEGALRIVVGEGNRYTAEDGENNKNLLQITGIGVELAENQWKIIHHFCWEENPGFCGTEAIQIWPAFRESIGVQYSDWQQVGDYAGRVLFDMGEQTYQSPYYFLGNQTYTSNKMFMAEEETTEGFATFSMPRGRGVTNPRGYVSYTAVRLTEDAGVFSWTNYVHQRSCCSILFIQRKNI